MRLASALFLLSLTGCSFDFASFGAGSGGAGATSTGQGTSTGVGPGATSSVASGSGATSSGSGVGGAGGAGTSTASGATTASSTAATGTGGGGPTAYPPCDARTDAFTDFPGVWTILGNASTSNAGQHAKLTAPSNNNFAGAAYNSTGPNNCMVEIDTQAFPSSGFVYVSAFRDMSKNFGISFDNGTKLATVVGLTPASVGGSAQALGFVLTNGSVYFVYRASNQWKLVGSLPRPGWIDDGQPTAVGFGLVGGTNGKDATFDNYNLTDIFPADIGL